MGRGKNTMDLSSLAAALSKIDVEGDLVADQCMKIIAEMSQAAEIGQDTLTWRPIATSMPLIRIYDRLIAYFPDVSIKIVDGTLLIDWS